MYITEFLDMGGFAFYVWTSWAIAFVLMTALVFYAQKKRKTIFKKLSQQQLRAQTVRDERDQEKQDINQSSFSSYS